MWQGLSPIGRLQLPTCPTLIYFKGNHKSRNRTDRPTIPRVGDSVPVFTGGPPPLQLLWGLGSLLGVCSPWSWGEKPRKRFPPARQDETGRTP